KSITYRLSQMLFLCLFGPYWPSNASFMTALTAHKGWRRAWFSTDNFLSSFSAQCASCPTD
ncbi:hypothetical protein, partial [Pseudomonas syringae]|uniref:hypothetical protein n=1 Tax=Pseudomonas syringae TaxID=317 RepID=UPI001C556F4C